MSTRLERISATLSALRARRGTFIPTGLTHNFVRLNGGRLVECTAFEPDPATYRGDYYYNAAENRLYKRTTGLRANGAGRPVKRWVAVP